MTVQVKSWLALKRLAVHVNSCTAVRKTGFSRKQLNKCQNNPLFSLSAAQMG
jgi:hypothetical protein